jgi:hypothetical protein
MALHPCKVNYFTRNKEQSNNFVKDKESTKKGKLGKRKGKRAAKYCGSKTSLSVVKACYPDIHYGDAAASVHLMRTIMMIIMAMMTVVLVIVGVLMLGLKAISQQI